MRFTIPLRKLSKLDVKYVSLVDRGANRIPFRIIKQEQDMSIDLARLGFRTKKADAQSPAKDEAQAKPEATLTAVVLAKNDQSLINNARTALAEEGIDLPDTKVFEDGTVALCKGEYEDGALVRVDENVAVVLKAFEPWGGSATDSSFAELVASRGFYDNVRTAMNIASDSLYASMYDAKTPAEAGAAVKKLMDDLSAYVVSLSKALPVTVFKAEKAVGGVVGGAPKKPGEGEDEDMGSEDESAEGENSKGGAAAAEGEKTPAADKTAPAADTGDKTPAEGDAEKPAEGEDDDKSKKKPVSMEEVASTMESALTPVLEVLSTMAEKMRAVSEAVSAVTQKVEAVEKTTEQKIDVLAQKADTASRAVRGAVVASETLGDAVSAPTKVKKQDADPRSGVFDTAFIRR